MNINHIVSTIGCFLHFLLLTPLSANAQNVIYDPGFSGWATDGYPVGTDTNIAKQFCADFHTSLSRIINPYSGPACYEMIICNSVYSVYSSGWIDPERVIAKVPNACSAGSVKWMGCLCKSAPSPALTVTPTASAIPAFSGVQGGKVLTSSKLVLTLQQSGKPVGGRSLSLISDRGYIDTFVPSTPVTTDANGKASATISTRTQPGLSTVSASDTTVQTTGPGQITWLPARYDAEFLVTCYTIADEASAPAAPSTADVCGLPKGKSYRNAFLKDAKMQGSGTALDGTIIHYSGNGCYNQDACARTATGACATVGTTIAVDQSVVPKRSTVNVDVLGVRQAQDTGGAITGYHIDDYMGPQPAMCRQLGRRHSRVTLVNY
jgi:3D (Asp-Asp-Asp) domain-containing protein